MPPKALQPLAKQLMKAAVALELLGLMGVYALFRSMDSSQDFRSTMSRRFPSVLEVYYQSNEWAGISGIRERDRQVWEEAARRD
ncbi:unnamed protein product [Ophioblennius macclurei]